MASNNSPTQEPLDSDESKDLIYNLEELWEWFMERRNGGGVVLPNGMTTRIKPNAIRAVIDDPSPEYVALKGKILELKAGNKNDEIHRLLQKLALHQINPLFHPFPRVEPLERDDDVQEFVDLSNYRDPQVIDVEEAESTPAATARIKQEDSGSPASASSNTTIGIGQPLRRSNRAPVQRKQIDPTNENALGINQRDAIPKDKSALGTDYWEFHLKPWGWKHDDSKGLEDWNFIPVTLKDYTLKYIQDHGGIEGVHYAKGSESLYHMVQKYAEFVAVPGEEKPVLNNFDDTQLVLFRQKLTGKYEGMPSNIQLYDTLMKLGPIDWKDTGEYVLEDKRYNQQDLLIHFVKNGIPNKAKLTMAEKLQLEELVRFAHVDRANLTSATSNINGYSPKIPDDKSVRPLLKHFGFQPALSNNDLWFPPQGQENGMQPMPLDQVRDYIRENESWNAGRRSRVKTGDDDKRLLFTLRLWGATSPTPLPEYPSANLPPAAATATAAPGPNGHTQQQNSNQSGTNHLTPTGTQAAMTDITNRNVSSVPNASVKAKQSKRKTLQDRTTERSGKRPAVSQEGGDAAARSTSTVVTIVPNGPIFTLEDNFIDSPGATRSDGPTDPEVSVDGTNAMNVKARVLRIIEPLTQDAKLDILCTALAPATVVSELTKEEKKEMVKKVNDKMLDILMQ